MKTKAAVKHFGSVKEVAQVLGIWVHCVHRWSTIVPKPRAYELHVKSGYKLDVGESDY